MTPSEAFDTGFRAGFRSGQYAAIAADQTARYGVVHQGAVITGNSPTPRRAACGAVDNTLAPGSPVVTCRECLLVAARARAKLPLTDP